MGMNTSETLFSQRASLTLRRRGNELVAVKTTPSVEAHFSQSEIAALCRQLATAPASAAVTLHYTYTGPKILIKEGLFGSVSGKPMSTAFTFEKVE